MRQSTDNQEAADEGELLLIDKPYTWTSFDVVKKLKWGCKFKKIGHAGTLDPLATGLLILCTGKRTKQIDSYQAQEKEYEGSLVLGKTTPSVDLETEFDAEYPTDHITDEALQAAAQQLTGPLQQLPPIYSAVRLNGERLYKKARRGESVEIQPRAVTVTLFEIQTHDFPTIHFRIICSKGTYIRSLVRDFGVQLESGAYLSALRRTRIGKYHVTEASELMSFIQKRREELSLNQDI
ncbi:tRNA pseudouridine(55) synthase TruB [Arundinibacter roseus]|uniref:tRNA pseudouridine synthase B n=1 Tax=Arundinibacter roseus TaxID=2070510 RepID=A0A4V2X9S4_9BACT|nr:tRNA pseudouridine(55) synthase TruB [Arundinibacter roseus]TDB64475.1 tRNA pseudouridine(55) synthase TruB [Arundinibacter roseus]